MEMWSGRLCATCKAGCSALASGAACKAGICGLAPGFCRAGNCGLAPGCWFRRCARRTWHLSFLKCFLFKYRRPYLNLADYAPARVLRSQEVPFRRCLGFQISTLMKFFVKGHHIDKTNVQTTLVSIPIQNGTIVFTTLPLA